MPPNRHSTLSYDTTTVQIRSDLNIIRKAQKWNLRKIMEEKLLTMITPQDLAYSESVRLTKELEKNKKTLEETEFKEMEI